MNNIIRDITKFSYIELANIIPDDVDKNEVIETFEKIINDSLSAISPAKKPFLINVCGIPGSGKSTYCKMLLYRKLHEEPDYSNALYISFDKIMEDNRLPFSSEVKQSPQDAFERWELPARIVGYELLKRSVEKRINILFEHSSAIIIKTPTTIKKPHVELFKYILSKGYEIHFRFIFVYDNEAKLRVKNRAKQTGRIIPDNYIMERSDTFNLLRPEYKKLSTSYIQIEQCELKL